MCGGSGKYKTFLGAARGSAAAGMFKEFTGRDIRFFELIKYMFLIG
jgi:sodium-dependent dicarboxylate transporter 2/3/5